MSVLYVKIPVDHLGIKIYCYMPADLIGGDTQLHSQMKHLQSSTDYIAHSDYVETSTGILLKDRWGTGKPPIVEAG